MSEMQEKRLLPVIALHGLVVFPGMHLSFDLPRQALPPGAETLLEGDGTMALAALVKSGSELRSMEDIYPVGALVEARQIVKANQDTLRILVEGLSRVMFTGLDLSGEGAKAEVTPLEEPEISGDPLTVEASMRYIKDQFVEFARLSGRIPPEVMNAVLEITSPGKLADGVALHCFRSYEDRLQVLRTVEFDRRLQLAGETITREVQLARLEDSIQDRMRFSLSEQQKERFLHEQIRAIYQELGEDSREELSGYREMVDSLPMPDEVKDKVRREIDRLERTAEQNPEYQVLRNWVEWILELPWGVTTKDDTRIATARRVLERDHEGLKQVKDRVLDYLAVRLRAPNMPGPILCFVGPPGVGKTSIARSIARAMGRKFVRMSLGGLRDEAEIRGHRRTYVGAIPGRIVSAIKQAGSMNPLFLLDELDKMSHDFRGDPASALLEVLDGEQNNTFRDLYLDIPFDLSGVMFVATANTTEGIPPALLDRLEVIRIEGYTYKEKVAIARKHLIPKQLERHALTGRQLVITKAGLERVIWEYTREAGVRSLEREIGRLCRRTARVLAEKGKSSVHITHRNVEAFLGVPQYYEEPLRHENVVGQATGLAWTAVGGVTLTIEVNTMAGSGHLELTGSLGEVMKESAVAALSYIRSHAGAFGLERDFYKQLDIQIHVPEGATPTDGPSAGITIATALVSALTGRPARGDVAMTGEVTLRGRVLPIGGLKEKSMAAHREGIPVLIFPAANARELEEVDEEVKSAVRFVPVQTLDEVLAEALLPGEKQ